MRIEVGSGGTWTPSLSTPGMAADELEHWQLRAALLDPLAYTLLNGSGATTTVPVGETWYVVSGWQVDAGAATLFQRKPDVLTENFFTLTSGETLTLEANAGAHVYICKPATVIAADSRYTTDPRGLYYGRRRQLDEATQHNLGHTNAGTTSLTTTFPTDFTYGAVVHATAHDVAWVGLEEVGATHALNLNNEISDSDPIRFAERICLPFARATFPKMKSRGAASAQGSANVRYVKLPSGW